MQQLPRRQTRGCLARAAGAATALWPSAAPAHVKWFCGVVDVSRPPLPIGEVASPLFFAVGTGFLLLVFLGLAADGWVARLWPWTLTSGGRLAGAEEAIVRAGIGVYCLLLWDNTAIVPWGHIDGAVLTPELLGHDRLIDGLQLAAALLVISRRSCAVAAIPLLALVGEGVARYGVFHMTDYVYFLGFAAYLALTPLSPGPWRRLRLPILATSLGFSLMWTAVEKFLYPGWTATILALHPDITAGLPIPTVVTVAGFVEFSLAFYLIVGRGLLRLGALALAAVFVSAMPEFGHLDIVGHMPILAILFAVLLRGATPLQATLRIPGHGPLGQAAAIAGLYLATLAGLTALYYGLQLTAV